MHSSKKRIWQHCFGKSPQSFVHSLTMFKIIYINSYASMIFFFLFLHLVLLSSFLHSRCSRCRRCCSCFIDFIFVLLIKIHDHFACLRNSLIGSILGRPINLIMSFLSIELNAFYFSHCWVMDFLLPLSYSFNVGHSSFDCSLFFFSGHSIDCFINTITGLLLFCLMNFPHISLNTFCCFCLFSSNCNLKSSSCCSFNWCFCSFVKPVFLDIDNSSIM